MTDTLIETEAERLETLRAVRQEVKDLKHTIENLRTELLGALNDRDSMKSSLEQVSGEATKYRAVEALVLAITEKTR